MTFKRAYHSIRMLLIRSERGRAEYLKKNHILGNVGENCRWGPWMIPLYPELIKIHDNVVVHKRAHIIVHDMINRFLEDSMPGVNFGSREVLGPIEIHDNVYISMDASIMSNVEIGRNCIISNGAVVTSDIPANSIVSGNPAKVVGNFDVYVLFRRMHASQNHKFPNQFLPNEVAYEVCEQFNKNHE